MAEKRKHTSASDSHSCSSKLACPVSIVSLLICTAALVRVEIINQRVHSVEDLLAEGSKVSTDTPSYKQSERVESVGEFDNKVTKEGRDAKEAPPRVQLALGPTCAKSGQNVTLPKCHVTGYPAPVITWWKLPGSLPKDRTVQDGGVLTVVGAEKHDIGSYVCYANNSLGEASAVTSLVVFSVPKFNTKPPETVNKLTGDELSLSCSATGDPPPTISWKRANGAWEEERMKVHGGSLKISSLTESDSGIYICQAKVPYSTIEARTELVVKAQGNGGKNRETSKDSKHLLKSNEAYMGLETTMVDKESGSPSKTCQELDDGDVTTDGENSKSSTVSGDNESSKKKDNRTYMSATAVKNLSQK
ncbi:hypothetical protein OS493_030971 [Desmophyllum pertusum]|uniref:Ig-like domain-containing protein n=1 Tax=Desmophyllum pertusum TaxID=174260 RepID=A0A9X0D338_9CNID|nr:hypothetical protein OS493_030971 [Desmophyllum pertusum]